MQIKNYDIEKKICETRGSIIYKTKNNKTIKVQKPGHKYIENEIKMRIFLKKVEGIPQLIDYGKYIRDNYLVYDFIPETLYKNKINDQEVKSLIYQVLTILENIHNKGIVHCDISACNILFDKEKTKFYLNDFGQAKHFSFAFNECNANKFLGCPMYCSENVHNGIDYSPRDDLLSLVYVIYYTKTYTLPWCGEQNMQTILNKKISFRQNIWKWPVNEEIRIFSNYCFHLEINQKPNYSMLKRLFIDAINQVTIET